MADNPRPPKYRDRNPYDIPIVDADDWDILLQAVKNTANTFGGQGRLLLNSLANELQRLHRLRHREKEQREASRMREWARHKQVTGERHPDDDIPF